MCAIIPYHNSGTQTNIFVVVFTFHTYTRWVRQSYATRLLPLLWVIVPRGCTGALGDNECPVDMMHDAFYDEFGGVLPPTVRFHETVRDAVLSHSNGAVPASLA